MAITHFKDQKKLVILCDYCFQDITLITRIQCIPCTFDICISCFYETKPIKNHFIDHSYKAIEPLSFTVFTNNWTAHEELLLIEGIYAFGLGNWKDVSDFLGTKNEREVEMHFYEISKLQNDFSQEIIFESSNTKQEIKLSNKFQKKEIEDDITNISSKNLESNEENTKNTTTQTKTTLPDVSNPNMHCISSFMPYRKDFDTEFENEYENLIKEINNDTLFENDNMKELKSVLFDSYQNVLKIRNQKKFVILEKKLYDYKNLNTDMDDFENEILKNIKGLSQFLSVSDFNMFFKGLCIENYLYTMNTKKSIVKEDYLSCEKIRHPLLSDIERKICAKLKISYKEYLRIKNKIVEDKIKYKYMDYKKMRSILGFNNAKSEILYKFFRRNQWI